MLLDIHTHIERYKGSYKKTALKEIRKLGILSISNSVDLPSYEDNRELAEKNPLIIPSAGIHPINADYYINKFEEIETAVNSSLFVGEVGLDGKIPGDKTHFDNQKKVFEFILKRAKELDKPVIVHCREAEEETYEMLKRLKLERVVIHWYSGPIETYIKMVRRGFKFSIGFMVLHSDFIRVIARRINREQLLIETDNPAGYEKNHHIPG
ncbi:MAG: TatD family hydrolase, partial [Vulcanimicrobiota bacterium]